MKKVILGFLTAFSLVFAAQATIVSEDSFSYSNGSLVSISSGQWTTYSGTTGQVNIVSGRVFLTQSETEDVQTLLFGEPFRSDSPSVLYARFTLNVATLPTASSGTYFASFKDGSTTSLHGRIFATTNGAPTGFYKIGVANDGTTADVTLSANFSLNTDYTFVTRYSVSNAVTSIWLNPTSESDTGVSATDAATLVSPSYFGFRQNSGNGSLYVDNLVIGTVFSDVVTNVPPVPQLDLRGTLLFMTYNMKGNGATNWSTNAPQVQAIGRQLVYLQPDIIAFNEIPYTNTFEMTNWIKAFLPGYSLAVNSGTDGFIRNGIASRYPITRSQSWLDGADLKPFGYTNTSSGLADNFSRDLFEAQLTVPNYLEPLHVFVTHLKSGGDLTNDVTKRVAEARAISNYFVTGFLTTNSSHPYILSGDMNEDVFRPTSPTNLPLQILTSTPTGLHLTTPRNSLNGDDRTWSIQGTSLSSRIDYILPGGLMYSNMVASEIFRTDFLNPLPPTVQQFDDKTASDHLPVLMYFRTPYNLPYRITSFVRDQQTATLNWQSEIGRQYRVEASTNLINWTTLAANLTAAGTNFVFTTNVAATAQFFRIYRTP